MTGFGRGLGPQACGPTILKPLTREASRVVSVQRSAISRFTYCANFFDFGQRPQREPRQAPAKLAKMTQNGQKEYIATWVLVPRFSRVGLGFSHVAMYSSSKKLR